MAIIGSFTKQEDGYQGTIKTLALKAKVSIVPVEKTKEKAPDHRLYAGTTVIGAAWTTTSKAGKPYLSIRFDDPSLATGFFRLVETAEGHILTWNP